MRWDNKYYRHEVLEPLHGDKVMVYVDQHDASAVVVRDLEGRYLCEAGLSGSDAFARSYVEKGRDGRVKAQKKRVENKLAIIEAQGREAIEHERYEDLTALSGLAVGSDLNTLNLAKPAKKVYSIFASDLEK